MKLENAIKTFSRVKSIEGKVYANFTFNSPLIHGGKETISERPSAQKGEYNIMTKSLEIETCC